MAERPEDLNLPIAVINRLVKESLPDGVNVSKEARTAISKAASVFVLYATSCANNFALKAKRKTLTGQDVLSAMADMDFEKFVEPLQESLEVYRRGQKGKKDALERRKKDREAELAANNNKDEDDEDDEEDDDDDNDGIQEATGGDDEKNGEEEEDDDEEQSSNEGEDDEEGEEMEDGDDG